MTAPHRIDFLIYPDFHLLDLTGPLSILNSANQLSGQTLYAPRLVAAEVGLVRCSAGLEMKAQISFDQSLRDIHGTGTVLVVGSAREGLTHAMRDTALLNYIDTVFDQVDRIASVCSGSFLLAETGRLAGHRSATHWVAAERMAARYSEVDVDGDAIFLQSGKVWTSAGVTAGIDLALALIEADHGRQLALEVARYNVVPRIRSGGQSQYSSELRVQSAMNRHLDRLAAAIRTRPEDDWSVEQMSACARVSRRTLTRLCRDELDTSPAALAERIRLDIARQRLLDTDWPLDRVARNCGFGSLQRMDRAFARQIGVPPRAYRRRFRSAPLSIETEEQQP